MAVRVELKNVIKRYGSAPVIHGVDLAVEPGEFVVFVGPSGCGKSTLLRMIAGLEDITGGSLLIDGKVMNTVDPSKRGIAMVFQSYALYPHMTVYKNLAFGLETAGMPRAEIDKRVRAAAEILQIGPMLDRRPKALSGGQRQRVAIGRAIVREPRLFLFDEPLSNLDAELRVQMRVEIAKLHKQLGVSMIYVTHDQVEAMTMADKIVVLRQGIVEQIGPPLELYNHPANLFIAGFIGSPKMNFLKAEIANSDATETVVQLGASRLVLPLRVGAKGPVTLGLRPEHVRLTGDAPGLELGMAEVQFVEHLGGSTIVYAMLADGQALTLSLNGQSTTGPGSRIALSVDPGHCHVFGSDGQRVAA